MTYYRLFRRCSEENLLAMMRLGRRIPGRHFGWAKYASWLHRLGSQTLANVAGSSAPVGSY